ncbi:MAG: hypothetical protein WCJ95_14150 [Mariniphaga sp.]
MLQKIKNIYHNVLGGNQELHQIKRELYLIRELLIENQLNNKINGTELNKYEFQVYSQNGEDGIIKEIIDRLKLESGFFVEFGVQNGLETNTTLLLLKGWKGLWIEANETDFNYINKKFESKLNSKQLTVMNNFITAENVEHLFDLAKVPVELDLLSIDIDSNDYWVWKAIKKFSPKVVVIEYNAFYPPDVEWIMPYDNAKVWDSTTYYGASLKSLYLLGKEKGYKLIACSYIGVNAFFVREDLSSKFKDYPLMEIYQPVRYFLRRDRDLWKSF